MPVLSRARTASSLFTLEGLSNSTPVKPSFWIRLNLSSIEPAGLGLIMPYLTAKRRFDLRGSSASARPVESATARPRNSRRVHGVMSHHFRDSGHGDGRHWQRHRHIQIVGNETHF